MSQINGLKKISSTTVREQVYEQLRSLVIQGHYAQDYRFDLNQLSKDLGVSRTPLGAAIQQLKNEGLLIVKPRSGTFLNLLDEKDVREAFELRKILEVGATSLVLDKITAAEVAKISTLNDEMKRILEKGDYQQNLGDFISLDKQMHELFINSSQHKLLIDTYGRINTLLLVSRVRHDFKLEDSWQTLKEHEAIVSGLRDRNRSAIETAIGKHLDRALTRLLESPLIERQST